MWICSRCQTANKDGYTQCVQCSAPRNARRFGAGTPVDAPSVQAVSSQRRMQQPEEASQEPSPRRQVVKEPQNVKPVRPAGDFVRSVGLSLSFLLPLVVIALAALNHDTLMPVIVGLFLKPDPTRLALINWAVYVFASLIAVLTAMLPGLSLYALGHIMRGVRKR